MPDPVWWVNATDKNGRKLRTRTRETIGEDGVRRIERLPPHGHTADSDPKNPAELVGTRVMHVVQGDGTEARVVVTNAGATMATADDAYTIYMRRKAFGLGWLELGACPVAGIVQGRVRPSKLVSDVLKRIVRELVVARDDETDKHELAAKRAQIVAKHTCRQLKDGRCKHLVAERDARRVLHNQKMQADAQAQRDEQLALHRTIANSAAAGVGEVLKEILPALVAAVASKEK